MGGKRWSGKTLTTKSYARRMLTPFQTNQKYASLQAIPSSFPDARRSCRTWSLYTHCDDAYFAAATLASEAYLTWEPTIHEVCRRHGERLLLVVSSVHHCLLLTVYSAMVHRWVSAGL